MNKVIKSLYLTALAFNYASHAMESPSPEGFLLHQNYEKPDDAPGPETKIQKSQIMKWECESLVEGSARHYCNKLPQHITYLDQDEPITDELLISLNPEWKKLQKLDKWEKDQIINSIFHYPRIWHDRSQIKAPAKYIAALLAYVGANPSTALSWSAKEQDFQLAKYLFEKGANPNHNHDKNVSTWWTDEHSSLCYVKSIPLAELFIAHGAKTSISLLFACCDSEYPSNLMQFYLGKGISPNYKESWQEDTPLHGIAHLWPEDDNQIEKVKMLLNAGANSTCKVFWGFTPLHKAAFGKNKRICDLLIAPHLEAHQAFLGFLWYLKRNCLQLYRCKDVLRLCFKKLVPIRRLRALLSVENDNPSEKTAFESWPIDELNPKTCTYEKFLRLRQKNQGSIHKLEEIDL